MEGVAFKNGNISDKCQSTLSQSQHHLLAMRDINLLRSSLVKDALEDWTTRIKFDIKNKGFLNAKLRDKSAPREV